VKLLLDQNLSRKLVHALEPVFPETTHVIFARLDRATDSDIWHWARLRGFTIATKNTDMVDLCVLRGAPPKVLWLRVGNCATELILEVILRNQPRIASFEADSERVVLSLFRLFAVDA
jgi:predicted nuclease of predicted toxin-antitoxin system